MFHSFTYKRYRSETATTVTTATPITTVTVTPTVYSTLTTTTTNTDTSTSSITVTDATTTTSVITTTTTTVTTATSTIAPPSCSTGPRCIGGQQYNQHCGQYAQAGPNPPTVAPADSADACALRCNAARCFIWSFMYDTRDCYINANQGYSTRPQLFGVWANRLDIAC